MWFARFQILICEPTKHLVQASCTELRLYKLFWNSKLKFCTNWFQNNLCKSQSSYFGLIDDKICWSDKEQPVHRGKWCFDKIWKIPTLDDFFYNVRMHNERVGKRHINYHVDFELMEAPKRKKFDHEFNLPVIRYYPSS